MNNSKTWNEKNTNSDMKMIRSTWLNNTKWLLQIASLPQSPLKLSSDPERHWDIRVACILCWLARAKADRLSWTNICTSNITMYRNIQNELHNINDTIPSTDNKNIEILVAPTKNTASEYWWWSATGLGEIPAIGGENHENTAINNEKIEINANMELNVSAVIFNCWMKKVGSIERKKERGWRKERERGRIGGKGISWYDSSCDNK